MLFGHLSSLEKGLFRSSARFLIGWFEVLLVFFFLIELHELSVDFGD